MVIKRRAMKLRHDAMNGASPIHEICIYVHDVHTKESIMDESIPKQRVYCIGKSSPGSGIEHHGPYEVHEMVSPQLNNRSQI